MATSPNLGFLTVHHGNGGYLGGYLVTNVWGRPLEFRLTTAVQPNRVQEILYGKTLRPYLFADLIGRVLLEKTATVAEAIVTDNESLLDVRLHLDRPVAWLAAADHPLACSLRDSGAGVCPTAAGMLVCHPRHADDARRIQSLLEKLDSQTDLAEPFTRIQEALQEAWKMGAANRA